MPPASGSDPQFKVRLDFNRWHDVAELKSDFEKLEKAWPKFLKLSSLGKSHGGRDIILMTINNPDTGPEMGKPAMYIEANVHGNEIQGAEVSLYTIWYLMENYGRIDQITKLVERARLLRRPDGQPRRPRSLPQGHRRRLAHRPRAGGRRQRRRRGRGRRRRPERQRRHRADPQVRARARATCGRARRTRGMLEPVPPGETGDYVLLGSEGHRQRRRRPRQRGSGRRLRRQPQLGVQLAAEYIQGGAMDYPFQLPEAKAINDFLMAHPNIAGVQSYHNNGGMILRGPGAEWQGEYPARRRQRLRRARRAGRADAAVLPLPGDLERPLHRPRRLHRLDQRRSRHAVVLERAVERRPVLQQPGARQSSSANPNSPIAGQRGQYYFDDFLEFGDQYVEWKAFDHPQFGKVEMGGWKKTQGRVPPRFMNEELCHRNMAFSLYQADEMPQMKSGRDQGRSDRRRRLPRARRLHQHQADADDPGQGGARTTSSAPTC